MTRAFEDLFEVSDAFRDVAMPGRTDAWILADAVAAHGIRADPPALRRFRDAYLAHLSRELAKPAVNKRIMPGVLELLEALKPRDDLYLALLTGNYEAAAREKLSHFGLWGYFGCGAFGDDAPDRNGLLPRALDRIAECGGPVVEASRAVVIGDTPLDIACAAAGGARSVGVATGSFSADQLRAAGADVVFETLQDTERVLQVLLPDR